MNNNFIAVEFVLDDIVYTTFHITEILKMKVKNIEIHNNRIKYSGFSNYNDNSIKNVYGSLVEAQIACIEWGKEKGQIVKIEDIRVRDSK